MRKNPKTIDRIAGKTKQVVAEVLGDGKLDKEGRHQQEAADDEPDDRQDRDRDQTSLSKIANNLT